MHPAAKMLIGIILLLIPLGLYAYEFVYGTYIFSGTRYELHLLRSLWTVIQGIIPPFVLVVGLFIVWLELDEWRIEKELKAEEKRTLMEKMCPS